MYSLKTSSKLGRWFAYSVLAVLAILGGDLAANAIDISQPSNSTIMGASVCTGSPTTDALLVYGGSTWCGSTVNNAPLISGTASSLTIKSAAGNGAYVTVEPNGTTSGFAIGGSGNGSFFVYDNAAGIAAMQYAPSSNVLEVAPIGWDRGADLTQTNESRTPLTIYSPLSTTGVVNMPAHYVPSVAMTVRSWTLTIEPATGACTTQPTFAVDVNGTLEAASLVTTTSAANTYTVSGLAISVPASNYVTFAVDTAGSGCPWTSPSAEAIIELTTD